jgi:hypothetical protein
VSVDEADSARSSIHTANSTQPTEPPTQPTEPASEDSDDDDDDKVEGTVVTSDNGSTVPMAGSSVNQSVVEQAAPSALSESQDSATEVSTVVHAAALVEAPAAPAPAEDSDPEDQAPDEGAGGLSGETAAAAAAAAAAVAVGGVLLVNQGKLEDGEMRPRDPIMVAPTMQMDMVRRASKRERRRSRAKTEEDIAVAVVLRAAAEVVSPPGSPTGSPTSPQSPALARVPTRPTSPLSLNATGPIWEERAHHENLADDNNHHVPRPTSPDSFMTTGGREAALRDSIADLFADGKKEEKAQRAPPVAKQTSYPPLTKVPSFPRRTSSVRSRDAREAAAAALPEQQSAAATLERQDSARRRRRDSDLRGREREAAGDVQQPVVGEDSPEEQAEYERRRSERRRSRDQSSPTKRSPAASRERGELGSRRNTRPSTRDDHATPLSGSGSRPSSRDHAILGTSRDEKGSTPNVRGVRKFFDSWNTRGSRSSHPPLSGSNERPEPQRRGSRFGRSRKSEEVTRPRRMSREQSGEIEPLKEKRMTAPAGAAAEGEQPPPPPTVRANTDVVRHARQSLLKASRQAKKDRVAFEGGDKKGDGDAEEKKKQSGIRSLFRRWFSSSN